MIVRTSAFAAALLGAALTAPPASAQATEPFIGQLMPVAFGFCPRGWAEADGQVLAIASNTALFSLLGVAFGGDGRTTFALPDMRGRTAVHVGAGPGLDPVALGERGGRDSVTLTPEQLPAHTHALRASASSAASSDPGGAVPAQAQTGAICSDEAADIDMGPSAIAPTGDGRPVPVRDPFVGLRWCVALQGLYPSRP